MTFSISGVDAKTGGCGSAVASFSLAVGGTVSYSRVGVGVVNTRHYAHSALGQQVLDEMVSGLAPHEALDGALELRVDAHEDPVHELVRSRELFRLEFRQLLPLPA